MISDELINDIASQIATMVVARIDGVSQAPASSNTSPIVVGKDECEDITKIDLTQQLLVPNPHNAAEYLRLKTKTPARIGVFRAGPRYKTQTLLRFRADHAAAMDAVFTDVSASFIDNSGLFEIKSRCASRDEFLTRPDLGRQLDNAAVKTIREKCKMGPTVQIYASDGLSSAAVVANLNEILPAILQGLKTHSIEAGTPFFLKYGRVGAMDAVTEAVGSEVTVVLIGERPGLATDESMSAYMTYKGKVGMPEAGRTVVSNIHRGGTPAVEAGAYIAEIIVEMLKQKCSGLALKY